MDIDVTPYQCQNFNFQNHQFHISTGQEKLWVDTGSLIFQPTLCYEFYHVIFFVIFQFNLYNVCSFYLKNTFCSNNMKIMIIVANINEFYRIISSKQSDWLILFIPHAFYCTFYKTVLGSFFFINNNNSFSFHNFINISFQQCMLPWTWLFVEHCDHHHNKSD